MSNNNFDYTSSFTPFADQESATNKPPLSADTNTNTIMASMELSPSNPASKDKNNALQQSLTPLHIQPNDDSNATTLPQDEADSDIEWSIWSNAFFVAGGLFYLIATSWDYSIFTPDPDLDLDATLTTSKRALYEALWFMGPFVYLINSVIDVQWAMVVRKRDSRYKHLQKLLCRERQYQGVEVGALEEGSSLKDGVPLEQHQQLKKNEGNKHKHLRLRTVLVKPTKKLLRRMRKHMGHRRDLAAAATFGLAAFFGVAGCICGLVVTYNINGEGAVAATDDVVNSAGISGQGLEAWAGTLEAWSIHVYMLSAIFALWKNPCSNATRSRTGAPSDGAGVFATRTWFQGNIFQSITLAFNDVDSLESLGDAFFGIASVIDVILEDSTADDDILWWPIVSAVLWTLDALFYLRGDFVSLYLRKEVMSARDDDDDDDDGSAVEDDNMMIDGDGL